MENDGGSYAGFDVNPIGIGWCQLRYDERFRFTLADLYNSRYHPTGSLRADEYRFPYEDASFDVVLAASVLTHLLEDAAAHYLAEIARVLRPGGRAVLLEPQAGPRATMLGLARALPDVRWAATAALWRIMSGLYGRPTAQSLWNALEAAGLRVLRIDETLGGLGLLAVAEKP